MEAHTRIEEKGCLDGSSILAEGLRERGVRERGSMALVLLLLLVVVVVVVRRKGDDWRSGSEYVISTPSLDIRA